MEEDIIFNIANTLYFDLEIDPNSSIWYCKTSKQLYVSESPHSETDLHIEIDNKVELDFEDLYKEVKNKINDLF